MKLAEVIAIYGGGPGSGCNPAVGHCGRHPSGITKESNSSKKAASSVIDNRPVAASFRSKSGFKQVNPADNNSVRGQFVITNEGEVFNVPSHQEAAETIEPDAKMNDTYAILARHNVIRGVYGGPLSMNLEIFDRITEKQLHSLTDLMYAKPKLNLYIAVYNGKNSLSTERNPDIAINFRSLSSLDTVEVLEKFYKSGFNSIKKWQRIAASKARIRILAWCNPATAKANGNKCGRTKGATKYTGISRTLVEKINENGGFTVALTTKDYPKQGFALSVSPENERILDAAAITPNNIRTILKEYEPALKIDKRAHVGGWYDRESKKVFLDVSIVTKDRNEALTLAKKYNQLAIFDLQKGKTIKTGVKRKITAEQEKKKGKVIRFDFRREATPEEIVEYLKQVMK